MLIETDFVHCNTDDLENGVHSLVGHLCDFCKKDAIERYHCSGTDSHKCSEQFKKVLKNVGERKFVKLIERKLIKNDCKM